MAFIKTRFVVIILIVFLTMSVGIVSAAPKAQDPVTEFRLTASDPSAGAELGRSVAIDGNLVAVGMGADGADGAVYLYRRQGTMYVLEEKLVNPDATPKAEFGRSVAIQGTTVLVGARFAQAGTTDGAGAVYVFKKNGKTWRYENKVVSPSPQAGDNFGRALAIQGNLLVVTARKEKIADNDVGAAYVFTYKDGGWKFQTKLVAGDPAASAYFGQSVALQGNLMVISARNADPNGAGAIYLFRKARDGWNQFAKVTPSDGIVDDQYGFAIAIKGDTIGVTARRADPGGKENAGAAYVYSLKGDSVQFVTRLTPGDAVAKDEFGQSVAFVGDVIAVGAWRDDKAKGSIYLFSQKGGQWSEIGKISASDGIAGDEFGYSLAAQGNRMVTGAHKVDLMSTDGDLITDCGAAYVLLLKP